MPITQPRLLALLEAGEAFQSLHQTLADAVQRVAAAHRQGTLTADAAFRDLALFAEHNPARAAALTIREERVRYNLTHKRNEYLKHKKARVRQGSQVARAIPDNTTDDPLDLASMQRAAAALDAEDAAAGQAILEVIPQSAPQVPGMVPGYSHLTPLAAAEIERQFVLDEARAKAKASLQAKVKDDAAKGTVPGQEPEAKPGAKS